MRKIITCVFLMCFSVTMMGQDLEAIEKDIKQLSGAAIQAEWEALNVSDQSMRTEDTFNSDADITNLYKVALMVHYHGYPTSRQQGYPAYVTPWLVWVHCPNTALSQYTFPIILKGRDEQQLPEGRFPNYFVGGLLLHIYGLDMEFDTDFQSDGMTPIARMLYRLEEERHEIDLARLKKLTEEAYALNIAVATDIKITMGKWSTVQHGDTVTFSVAKVKKDFYLMKQTNEGTPGYSKLKLKNNDLDYMEFAEGYGHYHLENKNDGLHVIDHTGKTVKVLKPVKIKS